jgi:integrase
MTATRSGETRKAVWAEIDEERALWIIPAKRMKMKRPHQIPLSPAAWRSWRAAAALSIATASPLPGARGHPMSDITFTKFLLP